MATSLFVNLGSLIIWIMDVSLLFDWSFTNIVIYRSLYFQTCTQVMNGCLCYLKVISGSCRAACVIRKSDIWVMYGCLCY